MVAGDPEYRLAARWTDCALHLNDGCTTIETRLGPDGLFAASGTSEDAIKLSGSDAAWEDFLEATPLPPNHSILGMERRRTDFKILGDRHTFLRNLRPLSLALDLLRTAANARTDQAS